MSGGPGLEFEYEIAKLESQIASLERQTSRDETTENTIRDLRRNSSPSFAKLTDRSMLGKPCKSPVIRIAPTHVIT